MFFSYFSIIIISYLIGAIPAGLIIGKFLGVDLRQHGSKNIGATNAYRTLGIKSALWVFLADALKGVIGVCIGKYFVGGELAGLLGGLAAVIGHNWPVYLAFKGGRGVATSLGMIALIAPLTTLVVFLIWLGIVYFSGYVSLASIIAAALTPFLTWYWGESAAVILFTLVAAVLIILRHIPNIDRLLNGREGKIKAGSAGSIRKLK